jgi:hypothetical protein
MYESATSQRWHQEYAFNIHEKTRFAIFSAEAFMSKLGKS